jgi:hypothetical protein
VPSETIPAASREACNHYAGPQKSQKDQTKRRGCNPFQRTICPEQTPIRVLKAIERTVRRLVVEYEALQGGKAEPVQLSKSPSGPPMGFPGSVGQPKWVRL